MMNELTTTNIIHLPDLVQKAGGRAGNRFLEFFTANIRNPHTRRAYSRGASKFLTWCKTVGINSLQHVEPIHVATWVELEMQRVAAPTVKQYLAGLRHLFDWMVTGQVLPFNPAASVRGPRYSTKRGKTPTLSQEETGMLLGSIATSTIAGLRDKALIALMAYSFARVGAVTLMKVEDVFTQHRRLYIRLHEKGGKEHTMPCHHNLEIYLLEYLEKSGLEREPKAPLFPTISRDTKELSRKPIAQQEAYAMIQRRIKAVGINTKVGNHSFRATGITTYLKAGGLLEIAANMANHASTRTTQLYDRRAEDVTLDEVERIRF
jgi:site-specific recombinase XerD